MTILHSYFTEAGIMKKVKNTTTYKSKARQKKKKLGKNLRNQNIQVNLNVKPKDSSEFKNY